MDLFKGNLNSDDYSLYGYTNEPEDENLSEYIYGKLNKEVEIKEYTGKESETAIVEVDNTKNNIKVDVKKVPKSLKIKANGKEQEYDGSQELAIDLDVEGSYVTEHELQTTLDNRLINEVYPRINSETQERKDEDINLDNKINQEISDRTTQDENLHSLITNKSYNSLQDIPELNTDNSNPIALQSNEKIKGIINLHKISKTGRFTDLEEITEASETSKGVIEIASLQETESGYNEFKAITPYLLKHELGKITSFNILNTTAQPQKDAYIRTGSEAFSQNWLSLTEDGEPLDPTLKQYKGYYFKINTEGEYKDKFFRWVNWVDSSSYLKYKEVEIWADGQIFATEENVQEVATSYIEDNYERIPQHLDALIITFENNPETPFDNDKVLYIYSKISNIWLNSGLNKVDLSDYLQVENIVNNLDGGNGDTKQVLGASQGKVLNEKITENTNNITNLQTNKLDKIEDAGIERVYGINVDGTQETIGLGNGAHQLVKRGYYGFITAMGGNYLDNFTGDNDATPKIYVDTKLDKKLDKVENRTNVVYGTDNFGNNIVLNYSWVNVPDSVMYRAFDGKARIETPATEDDSKTITNKEYVDGKITPIVDELQKTLKVEQWTPPITNEVVTIDINNRQVNLDENKFVQAKAQTFTNEEKQQIKLNLDLASSSYNSLLDKPKLNTDNSTSLSTNNNEEIKNTINLHKISKTGKSVDLIDSDDLVRQTQLIEEITNRTDADNNLQTNIDNIVNNTTIMKNHRGGFAAGTDASAGEGGAIGWNAKADAGGAVGSGAETFLGGSVGIRAKSTNGGAIGFDAYASDGFSGGNNAQVKNTGTTEQPQYINAIQLGEGTNEKEKSLQIYGDNIYDSISHQPNGPLKEYIDNLVQNKTYNSLQGIPKLDTTQTNSLPTLNNEDIKDTISLHKISKTGNFTDLNNITQSSQANAGVIKIANSSEIEEGTNETKAVTPKQLKEAITKVSSLRILNKSEVIEATESTIQNVCTQYIINNYNRQPQDWDGLIVTLTDRENDKILFIYSTASSKWIDAGVSGADLTHYLKDSDVINNLTSEETQKPLSAKQGNVLDNKITSLDTRVTENENKLSIALFENDFLILDSGNSEIQISFERIFNQNSWNTISGISSQIASQNMTAEQVTSTYGWNIGDTKDVTLTTGKVITFRIIDFNHDTLSSDHTTKAGITLQMVNCLAIRYPMNSTNTNAGGWGVSKMRTETMPTIKATLPQDLQNVIKLVDKKAANGGSTNYSATETLSDDLFLLAGVEIFGAGSSYGHAQDGVNEGTQYAYWATNDNNNARIKKFDTDADGMPETATTWWERSSCCDFTDTFCCVYSNGITGYDYAGNSRGVAFGFCV